MPQHSKFRPVIVLGIFVLLGLLVATACMTSQPPVNAASAKAEEQSATAPSEKTEPAAAPTTAPAAETAKPEPARPAASLPLTRVTLFSSGVGYFEHNGEITGNAKVDLKFKIKDINDLLKSMVVQDFDGGHISTVGYGSDEPLDRRLSTFAMNLNGNPRLAQLLEQIRGEMVEVDAPNKIQGTIVSLETRRTEIEKDRIVEQNILNLMTDGGLRSVVLESVGAVKLLDPKLDAELHKALSVLASAHETEKKTVALDFRGEGRRKVRVGYIEETPIWKTSYRLVLSDEKKPFLQGWAIVQNPSEEDWTDARLALVSGRPISFTMDLYQPTYIARPEAHLELFGSLGPQVYAQDLAKQEMAFRSKRAAPGGMGGGRGMAMQERAAKAMPMPAKPAMDGGFEAEAGEPMNLAQGAQPAAAAGNVGELFQYVITTPVTLARHESAMLPILGDDVKAEKFSIYDPAVEPTHPLNGLKLTNTTALHLMQGPITVFDGGAYAGDAMIRDIPPGAERLISYALDLDTEVAPENKGQTEQITSVRINKGTLVVDRKYARTQQYTVKNSGKQVKKVLIEYAHEPIWTLIAPKKPEETTRDKYRFLVEAKPGEPAKLAVEEQRSEPQMIALTNIDDGTIAFYLRSDKVSDKVKAALKGVIEQKQAIQNLAQQRAQLEQQIHSISDDQARIRENMGKLDHNTDLYKRYVKELSDQEDTLAKLRPQINELQEHENLLRKALDDYLNGLDAL